MPYTEDDFSKSTHQNFVIFGISFTFYHILNNANLKMQVEETNFVKHLIITVQLYY